MSRYIIDYKDAICYIDTDGIKLLTNLNKSEVGKELGKMKDEGS